MRPAVSPLQARTRALAATPFASLRELLDPWLVLPENFGQPARHQQ